MTSSCSQRAFSRASDSADDSLGRSTGFVSKRGGCQREATTPCSLACLVAPARAYPTRASIGACSSLWPASRGGCIDRGGRGRSRILARGLALRIGLDVSDVHDCAQIARGGRDCRGYR